MPHDLRDRKLEIGDRVLMPCRVTQIQEAPEFCNVTIETTEGMPPHGAKSQFTLNTRQMVYGRVADVGPAPA